MITDIKTIIEKLAGAAAEGGESVAVPSEACMTIIGHLRSLELERDNWRTQAQLESEASLAHALAESSAKRQCAELEQEHERLLQQACLADRDEAVLEIELAEADKRIAELEAQLAKENATRIEAEIQAARDARRADANAALETALADSEGWRESLRGALEKRNMQLTAAEAQLLDTQRALVKAIKNAVSCKSVLCGLLDCELAAVHDAREAVAKAGKDGV